MSIDKPCFFMPCYDDMEKDCLKKGLLGRKHSALPFLKTIKKGDLGFLLNVDKNQLLGVFEAEGKAKLDIDSGAWRGLYRAQVKVTLLVGDPKRPGEPQRVKDAEDKLQHIVHLREVKGKITYKVPSQSTYGPDVTEKVLSLFKTSELSQEWQSPIEDSGIMPGIPSQIETKGMTALMTDLVAYVRRTNEDEDYDDNFEPRVRTHPIPFFGDLESAEVITVGVNPSAGEFKGGRNWPSSLPPDELLTRLKGYFKLPDIPPHPWFQKWEEGLQLLNCSYRRDAAHLDLSPRATIAMSQVPDKDLFERMIREDIQWFFNFLQCATSATLMLIAGAVTDEMYMNEFLAEHAPRFGFRLDGSLERSPGQAKTAHHTLIGPGVDLPVFFCSVSPSAKNSDLLVERIRENRDSLTQHLSS